MVAVAQAFFTAAQNTLMTNIPAAWLRTSTRLPSPCSRLHRRSLRCSRRRVGPERAGQDRRSQGRKDPWRRRPPQGQI